MVFDPFDAGGYFDRSLSGSPTLLMPNRIRQLPGPGAASDTGSFGDLIQGLLLDPLALVDPESGKLIEPSAGASKPAIGPGARGLVRMYLDTPLAIWAGQRIILRAYSAAHANVEGLTVGGGVSIA